MQGNPATSELLRRARKRAFSVALVAGAALLVGFFVDRARMLEAYLVAWLFWLAPALGSLGVLMLHDLTGGAWGRSIRVLLEAAARTLPWLALAFVPVLLGMRELYPWARASAAADDPLIAHKAAYLNAPFFAMRAALFLGAWIAVATIRSRLARRFDRSPGGHELRRLQLFSAGCLVLYVLSMTFASVDWAMSLEPHWFSTIYGIHFVIGQALTSLCLSVVAAAALTRTDPPESPSEHWMPQGEFHDLGNLMLAFVLLWAYVSFSQFLIIWSGDLPEETPWYLRRSTHGWQAIAALLAALHFAVPFALLLARKIKRRPSSLAAVALGLLVLRYLDLYWLVVPAFERTGSSFSWMDLAAVAALGGLWIGLATRSVGEPPFGVRASVVPGGEIEGAVRA